MCMSKSRRVQILVQDEQYARLEHEADRRGGSVASVIRDAVDRMLPPTP
ncbi:MAG: ribbon-helix-helix protein, CopG family [Egibacteraceae bacterium]